MRCAVKKQQDGRWCVVASSGETMRAGLSNSQAWREADKLSGEHLNRSEETTDWSVTKYLSESAG